MAEVSRAREPHHFYLSGIKESTYRALLSEKALSALEEIASDEEYPGSGDPTTLSLLTTLIHTCQMTKVLQIGTWIGFSTVAMAGALARVEKEGRPTLVTVDPAIPQMDKAKGYVTAAGLRDHVQFVPGSSLEPSVQRRIRELGPYDLVFIDSQHDYDVASVELAAFWPSVREGGILAAHDSSLFAAGYDTKQQGGVIRALNEWIAAAGIEQYLFLNPPLWNPVGLFITTKMPATKPSAEVSTIAASAQAAHRSVQIAGRSEISKSLMVLQVNAMAPSEQYRVHNVFEQLELSAIPHKLLSLSELEDNPDRTEAVFFEASFIIFHRTAYTSLLGKLCADARRRGVTLVYETDDLIFFPHIDPCWVDGLRHLPPHEVFHYYEGVERYKRMMQLCDVGLFSTTFLAALAQKMGLRRSWVLRNALGRPFLEAADRAYQQRQLQKGSGKVRLGYSSGTKTHDRDFAEFASVLLRVMERNANIELAILGHLELPEHFRLLGSRIRHYTHVPWVQVPEILATFDINLAPLELVNPFCRAKSELKYFEAGIMGIPTIASCTDEFRYAIENGKNGFLVSNEVELEDSLLRLIGDKALRKEMGIAAREDVMVRYLPSPRAKELVQILHEMKRKEALEPGHISDVK